MGVIGPGFLNQVPTLGVSGVQLYGVTLKAFTAYGIHMALDLLELKGGARVPIRAAPEGALLGSNKLVGSKVPYNGYIYSYLAYHPT